MDVKIVAIHVVTKALNDLVGACFDENGKQKLPDRRALMKAKGYLPNEYSNSYNKTNKKTTGA